MIDLMVIESTRGRRDFRIATLEANTGRWWDLVGGRLVGE